ncbi:MAG: LytR C-terminal domain-containing protein [Acidimicrobiales bacterium]
MGRRWVPLVVVAVGAILGLAVAGLPSRHHDAPLTVRSDPSSTAGVGAGPMPTTRAPTTAPPTNAPPTSVRAPADVRVVTVNASSVAGSAGRVGTRIRSMGWNVLPPGPDRRPQSASVVMYRSGFDGEARALATALGVDPTAIAVADASTAAAGDADLAVVIGDDLAKRSA